MNTDILKILYKDYTGKEPVEITALTGSGSNRQYFRLKGEKTLIGVRGISLAENKAFIYMAQHFQSKGLPVPHICNQSADGTCYLQEDLGDTSLFKAIEHGRTTETFSEKEITLLTRTIQQLPRIQFEGAEGMDFSYCYPPCDFNRRSILWDLNYFKYCFLKATGLEFQENLLEDDFDRLAEQLLSCETSTFMYRDFQSRNVIIKEGMPYFIDFQGGRKGPIYYDVASFLWQAKANLPESLRKQLVQEYLKAVQVYRKIDSDTFQHDLQHFVLFRTMQVLGAYGFRGYFERKTHFIESVPFAIANLRRILEKEFTEYPYLCKMLHDLTELPRFKANNEARTSVLKSQPQPEKSQLETDQHQEETAAATKEKSTTDQEKNKKKLTVRVISFSYKKGYPEDPSGNGGGYVFDCRGVHNPGRYEQYKQLTGLDQPVIDFLENDGEITTFLEHVYALANAHVARYIKRGFTNLMFCFGCTGGQHRSVYSAQHTAEYIHKKFGVKVEIIHREQHIERTLENL